MNEKSLKEIRISSESVEKLTESFHKIAAEFSKASSALAVFNKAAKPLSKKKRGAGYTKRRISKRNGKSSSR